MVINPLTSGVFSRENLSVTVSIDYYFFGGLFTLPPPDGLPVLLGQPADPLLPPLLPLLPFPISSSFDITAEYSVHLSATLLL